MKKWLLAFLLLATLLFLLLFPVPALAASRRGLNLWFGTLVPTLLPFLILSGFLIHTGLVHIPASLLAPVFGRLFGVSPLGSYACFIGFLCGFPMGAKVLADLTRNGRMDPEEASYLLGFINNVSPSFVITFLVTESLERPDLLLPTLLLLYGTAILYGLFTRPGLFHRKTPAFSGIKNASVVQIRFELLDACIYDAVNTLLKLGGYVVLFSVLAEMTACLPFLPEKTAALLGGMLEITSGISGVVKTFPLKTAYQFLIPLTAFGGLSAMSQTSSVLKGSGLSLKKYVFSKVVTAALTFLFVSFFLWS